MKLWLTTTENKCFVKMLWHLLGEYVKTIVLLVCSICTVHRFFYFLFLFFSNHRFVPFFFYSIFALFIQSFSLFIYSSILVSHFVFLFLVFCLYFFPPFIYVTVHLMFLPCERTVAVIVLWFHEPFYFFPVIGLCIFFLLNIDIS